MATVALVDSQTLSTDPYVIRRLLITGGTTAAAVAHGGPSNDEGPAIVVFTNLTAGAGAGAMACTARDGTNVTIDCRLNVADTIEVICIWVSAATGGMG